MAESHGQRGYGYFVPLGSSKTLLTPFNCENLPECEDRAECQGTANAIVHTSNEIKSNVFWPIEPVAPKILIFFINRPTQRQDQSLQ